MLTYTANPAPSSPTGRRPSAGPLRKPPRGEKARPHVAAGDPQDAAHPHGGQGVGDIEVTAHGQIEEAPPGGVVILAGKGAEQAQKRANGPEPCVPDGMLAKKSPCKRAVRAMPLWA